MKSSPHPPSDDDLERLLRRARPRETAGDERVVRVHAAVKAEWAEVQRATRRRRWLAGAGLGLAAAAGLAIAARLSFPPTPGPPAAPVVVASLLFATDTPASAVRTPVVAGGTLRTTAVSLATFSLAGGGELRLDVDTAVIAIGVRRLSLERGAVYVDSGAAAAPVTLETPAGLVRDIGTRFEVRIANGGVRVRVRDGEVRLERGGVPHGARAGGELFAAPDGEVSRAVAAISGADWAWVTRAAPVFQVDGAKLMAFLEWVSRESGWTVQFSDPELERSAMAILLRGSIQGLTVDEALAAVLPTCGLTHRLMGDRLAIDRAGRSR
jgi:hypothetical protein